MIEITPSTSPNRQMRWPDPTGLAKNFDPASYPQPALPKYPGPDSVAMPPLRPATPSTAAPHAWFDSYGNQVSE